MIKGNDPTLVAQAVQRVVAELLGDGDRSLMVEEVTDEQYAVDGETEIAPLINAAHTPPFLTDRRIVVGRHLGLFGRKAAVAPLVEWLANPLETTDLVLVWEKPTGSNAALAAVPKSLKEALKKAGGTELDAAPSGKGRKTLLADLLAEAPVRFDAAARNLITEHLGDEAGRVDSIIAALTSTFGEGAALTANEVDPFLGEASDVPPWELTDAIDGGDIGVALDRLHRMMGSGERHPLQILATLHGHYQRALALDGAPVSNDREAAELLGMKGSTFPAKKALNLSRRLGGEGIGRVINLLAEADLDVRGGSAMPDVAQMDVLVARLARLSRVS